PRGRRVPTGGAPAPRARARVAGRVLRLREPILHYSYDDIADHLRSIGKLTAVLLNQPHVSRRPGVGRLVLEPAWRFLRFYVLRRSALEGIPGLYAAAADAFYVFLRWACRARRQEIAPSDVRRLARRAE